MLTKYSKLVIGLLVILIINCCSHRLTTYTVSEEVAKNFKPKDLKTNNKILLVKVNYVKNPYKIQLPTFLAENYIGKFEIVPGPKSIDQYYPDLKIYKYVLVISGAITASDFRGISNKEFFFGNSDSTFSKNASSLYIFDRSSNHDLYETGEGDLTYAKQKGYSSNGSNVYSPNSGSNGYYTSYEVLNYFKLKAYIEVLNN